MASGALVAFQLPRGPRLHRADTARTDAASRVPGHNRGSFYHLFMEPKDPAKGRSHLSGGCRMLQLLPVPVSFPGSPGGRLCSPSYPRSHFHPQNSAQSWHILPRCLWNISARVQFRTRSLFSCSTKLLPRVFFPSAVLLVFNS